MSLPWTCPDHPEAQIRHEWNRTRTRVHLTGAEWESDSGHQYFCAVCRRELAPEEPVVIDSEYDGPEETP